MDPDPQRNNADPQPWYIPGTYYLCGKKTKLLLYSVQAGESDRVLWQLSGLPSAPLPRLCLHAAAAPAHHQE